MTDRELLLLISEDKVKGFSLLVDTYSALIYKIVSSVILPVGTREDAEECVSDAFLAFYNNLEAVDLEKGSIKGYLAVIAKRRAINLYHTLKREKNATVPYDEQSDAYDSDIAADYDTRAALINAIKALGEPDSTIVKRKYILGETAKEIGEYVSLSAEAVQKRLERSMDKLKVMLGGAFYG
ncbi:MAG: sigma-70 family RNA polymerase sigma factor [Clostridia bacterium]|nr:sigma-70 family RNA polymerase sigma factor [Clostridia bacterium]